MRSFCASVEPRHPYRRHKGVTGSQSCFTFIVFIVKLENIHQYFLVAIRLKVDGKLDGIRRFLFTVLKAVNYVV